MLTGVLAVSSARKKEGWLSDDACRDGMSIGSPVALARLNGREKLNAGRGKRVPPMDMSELMEGDLRRECADGDIGEAENPLLEENFR